MKQKREWIRFLTWWRNGSAFCISWFLILWVVYNSCSGILTISTGKLAELIILSVTGTFFFCVFFTRVFLRSWSFIARLTCFICAITVEECIAFYRLDFFTRNGNWWEWLIFAGIVLGLYLICIAIYQRYSKRKETLYTKALEQYQQKRSMENGK